jgi:hypothetical protein
VQACGKYEHTLTARAQCTDVVKQLGRHQAGISKLLLLLLLLLPPQLVCDQRQV